MIQAEGECQKEYKCLNRHQIQVAYIIFSATSNKKMKRKLVSEQYYCEFLVYIYLFYLFIYYYELFFLNNCFLITCFCSRRGLDLLALFVMDKAIFMILSIAVDSL